MLERLRASVWTDLGEESPAWTRRVVHAGRVLWLAAEGFNADACSLRASALTLASTLALVPALAVSFAYVRGLGWTGDRLESVLLQHATILSRDAISTVVSWVDNISIAGLGLMGALFALASAVSLLVQIEQAFDAVWGNPHGRAGVRRAADALLLLVLAPLLVAAVASSEAALRSSSAVVWLEGFGGFETLIRGLFDLAWYLLSIATFTALYVLLPSAPVDRRAAAVGGFAAGIAWQLVQSAYVNFQFGLAGYNAIYGALAQLPVFVFWMWSSWVLLLAGAEISAAYQNLRVCRRRYDTGISGAGARERLALAIAVELADAAYSRRSAPTLAELSGLLAMPMRSVAELFGTLETAGLVHSGGLDQRQCFLSLSPGSVAVERVVAAVRGDDGQQAFGERPAVSRVLASFAASRRDALGSATLADLVDPRE